MLNRDIKMMKFCRRLAIDNDNMDDRFKFGAVLTINREIISIGQNCLRSHPMQKKFGKNEDAIYLHAEIKTIVNALNHVNKDDLKNSTLYIHRVKKKIISRNKMGTKFEWVDGLACPCSGCQSAIEAFKIPHVIFSTDENDKYEEYKFISR